ncbi:MAG: cupredoxin family copper-binding protein [Candidatus Paceibacterota bacterium]|jgi:plastocyanin
MKKIIIPFVLLIIVGLGIYYFGFRNKIDIVGTSTQPSEVSGAVINIRNYTFNPATLSVKIGTKVTWINDDTAPHTIVSDSGDLLNSEMLSPGQSFSFTFNDVGTVNYHCGVHLPMKGSIIVTN